MKYQREDEIAKAVKSVEDKWMPLHSNESASAFNLHEERRKDQASHFILRLAFCTTADNIRWFVNQECMLFKIRFSQEMSRERSEFLSRYNSNVRMMNVTEKAELYERLRLCSPNKEAGDFYQVPFEIVPDLVGKRAVYLEAGTAYVPKCDSFSIILSKFRGHLEHWMERTARELPGIRDERIGPLLQLVKNTDAPASDTSRGFVDGTAVATDVDSVPEMLLFPFASSPFLL